MHDKLKAAFTMAVALEPEARERFVAELQTREPALAEQLVALLAADTDGDGLITTSVAQAMASFDEAAEDPWPGRELGPWRIISRIASGGMGSVFLAERSDAQYDQQVAIKIMGAQLHSTDALRRFRTERQILADLEHPCIARLIDGGTTETGLPYLVMEYIDGQAIDAWCDEQGLDLRARIGLFLDVCEAVEHAHNKLVVHRDLKPGNILVDGEGKPKLLDFGIARLVDTADIIEGVALTRAGAQALTPDYASPEQIRGDLVSVATDVYSLGVLLYVVLSGRLPFADSNASVDDKFAAILNREPERPSDAVTASSTSSAAAYTHPSRLRKLLAGDLDNIVLKALRKEPDRRYSSVATFAEDLRRYLSHRPVQARPAAFGYRARKYLRRNVASTATATLISVLVIAFSVNTALQNRRIALERDRAEQESETAGRVSDFLVELFDVADPNTSRGADISARAVVTRAAERLQNSLNDEPAVRVALLQTLGRVYRNLGEYEPAGKMLDESLYERMALYGESSLPVAETLFELGYLREREGDLEAARDAHQQALVIRRAQLADELLVANSLFALGGVYLVMRDNDKSRDLLEQALAIRERLLDAPNSDIGRTLNDLAILDWRAGAHAQAEDKWQRALEINEHALGANHPELVFNVNNVGFVKSVRGKTAEAAEYYRRALVHAEAAFDADHPALILPLENLSSALAELGLTVEARQLAERALAIIGEDNIAEQSSRGALLGTLAEIYRQDGEFSEAVRLFEESLAEAYVESPDGSDRTAQRHAELAFALTEQGEFEAAAAHARKTLAQAEPDWGTAVIRVTAHTVLASHSDNNSHLNAAHDVAKTVEFEASSLQRLAVLAMLCELLVEDGQQGAARTVLGAAREVVELGPGNDHPAAKRLLERARKAAE